MTTPSKGFKRIAPSLIGRFPGSSSKELARIALDEGLCASNAKDPIFSLYTTLDKEYREGRMPSIKKVDGRYYPAAFVVEEKSVSQRDPSVVITPSADALWDVDLLADVKDWSRNDAIKWLIDEGRKARRSDLDDLRSVWKKIKDLKQSAQL